MSEPSIPFVRRIDGVGKTLDVRRFLLRADVAGPEAGAALARAGLVGDLVAVDVECAITGSGGVKAAEVAAVIAGDRLTAPPHRAVRIALFGVDDRGRFSPLTAGRGRPDVCAALDQGGGAATAQPHALAGVDAEGITDGAGWAAAGGAPGQVAPCAPE
jgi:hypothetical protein